MKKTVFFLNSIFIIFIIFYFYYIYIHFDEIYFSIIRLIIFFAFPIIIILTNLIIINFYKLKIILNIMLFQSSIILSLFMLELFIQTLPNIKNYFYIIELKNINKGNLNTDSLLDYYSKNFSNDNDTYFPVYSANNQEEIIVDNTKILALGGIANKKIIFCNEAGKWIEYKSDELGFRNPKGIWDNKEIDIFILGDSYGQGTCVENENMIDYFLRDVYPSTLNLSYSMGGALIQLANLIEFGEIKKPKKVLHLYYSNDIPDTERENQNNILSNYKRNINQDLFIKEIK